MSFRSWLINWLEHEVKECATCVVYRSELDRMHRYNERLLEAITRVPEVPEEKPYTAPIEAKPQVVPWKVRRSILEAEDAQLAKAMKANKIKPLTEENLEAQLEEMRVSGERNAPRT